MIVQHDTLYNVDSKGKIRTWRMETEGGKHRTVAGLSSGKQTTSGWVICEAKNEGRANATTPEQQALLEVESDYKKKLEGKYYKTLKEAESAGSGMKFLQPMLAFKFPDFADKLHGKKVWCQPKLDGIRATVSKDGILSRAGKPIVAVPHILKSLEFFFERHPDAVLDGELYNHELKADFNTITSLVKKMKPDQEDLARSAQLIQYHVYDIASLEENFFKRISWVDMYVPILDCIKVVDTRTVTVGAELDKFYAEWLQQGYEGQMIRLDMPYENKRSKSLLKRKEFLDEEYPIVRIESGLGNWQGIAKRIVCKLPDGREFEAGPRGNMDTLRKLLQDHENGITPKYATIRYPNLTPDGIPRFGIATAFHEGKRNF